MKTVLEMMQWRFACKHYDTSKQISDNDLTEIMEVARLAPSSIGLQGWKFIVVTNKELQERLAPAGYNQPQITEASALVFCCAVTDFEQVLDNYLKLYREVTGKTEEESQKYRLMVEGMLAGRSEADIVNWLQKQVYLPGQAIMMAAAEKGIDSCPMEGFNADEVAKILELPENLKPTLLISLGYRNMNQTKRVRYDSNEVIIRK